MKKYKSESGKKITILRVLQDKTGDDSYSYEKDLFGAFGPTDVCHRRYVNSEGEIAVTSEDISEVHAENVLLGYIVFPNPESHDEWIDQIYGDNFYGDCSVSYRAWKDITNSGSED